MLLLLHRPYKTYRTFRARPDTSSFVVPTFDAKETEYLFSGGVFFLETNFDFLTSIFWLIFYIIQKVFCPQLKIEKIFHLWSSFVKLWGFKDCCFGHFDQFGTINARYNSRYKRVSEDLIRFINRSKFIERNLFAIIDLLQLTKPIFLYFIWPVGE